MPCRDSALLLCSDLDGTLIPDGRAPESERARPLLRRLAAHRGVCLVYVTGRDPRLVDAAIIEAQLPEPRLLIADVGASIYLREEGDWCPLQAWWDRIGRDWKGLRSDDILALLAGISGLTPQEPAKQARFKASFYADPEAREEPVLHRAQELLRDRCPAASLIWSREAGGARGLLDVLPASADKRQAIDFLRRWLGVAPDRTVFGGDSGNDLAVLTSGIRSVLVGNADPEVRTAALAGAAESPRLYLASGGYRGMNGNYAAGVLEGVVHFVPEVDRWLDTEEKR